MKCISTYYSTNTSGLKPYKLKIKIKYILLFLNFVYLQKQLKRLSSRIIICYN
jgi:hypothetical protein